jgi:peptidyl-prolyl cis-trans isomerase A (cyclophilin A)
VCKTNPQFDERNQLMNMNQMVGFRTRLLAVAALFTLFAVTTPAAEAQPSVEGPRVLIQTSAGGIEVELDAQRAPATVTNFLRYVDRGLYSNGLFHRTVTLANQPANKVKIEVIQGAANPARTNEFFPPIAIERTRDTGLKHRDGTLSMARAEPDSAQDEFFVCIGDQPELDFGGKRNPDGQGFAAFGKVVKGMEIVRRIHGSPVDGQSLKPPIRIERVFRLR